MSTYRLVRLSGPHGPGEWPLPRETPTLVGRREPSSPPTDVDLSPDRTVSRRHAQIWFEKDSWWIRDLNSKHGTRLGAHRIPSGAAVRCEPGTAINLGTTALAIFPPHWHRLRHDEVAIDLGVRPRFGYALALADARLITHLVVRNWGNRAVPACRLDLELAGIGNSSASVPRLAPGDSASVPPPSFQYDHRALLNPRQERRTWTVHFNGQGVDTNGLGSTLLAFNEWAYDVDHRPSLSAFVLPDHPTVIEIARAATTGLPLQASGAGTLQWVYEHLSNRWHIDYRKDPPSQASGRTQRLRLPSDILWDPANRCGEGTCIDLALLIAACLEVMRAQPVIAFVDLGTSWHALVGCWRSSRRRLDILPSDREQLLEDALWIDPNGCTRDPSQRAELVIASERAQRCLTDNDLVFALDIAAARSQGVQALPVGRGPADTGRGRRRSWLRTRSDGRPKNTLQRRF